MFVPLRFHDGYSAPSRQRHRSTTMSKHEAALQLALDAVPEEVLGALVRLVRETRFGSIEIVVHEGRITQIERRERVRFAGSDRER